MDFEEASRILNMELLGLTPETFDDPPGHVINQAKAAFETRITHDENRGDYVTTRDGAWLGWVVPNRPDMVTQEVIVGFDEFDDGDLVTYQEFPDVDDETTDTRRDYELTISFDAPTELEAQLMISAVTGFVQRRLNPQHPVFTARIDN